MPISLTIPFSANSPAPDKHNWQNRETNPLPGPSYPKAAPLTAFTLGTLPNGNPQQMQIIVSNDHGAVTATSWLGKNGGSWLTPHNPGVLNGEQSFSPLAANADGHLFAIGKANGRLREFKAREDGITWALVGNVTTL